MRGDVSRSTRPRTWGRMLRFSEGETSHVDLISHDEFQVVLSCIGDGVLDWVKSQRQLDFKSFSLRAGKSFKLKHGGGGTKLTSKNDSRVCD